MHLKGTWNVLKTTTNMRIVWLLLIVSWQPACCHWKQSNTCPVIIYLSPNDITHLKVKIWLYEKSAKRVSMNRQNGKNPSDLSNLNHLFFPEKTTTTNGQFLENLNRFYIHVETLVLYSNLNIDRLLLV